MTTFYPKRMILVGGSLVQVVVRLTYDESGKDSIGESTSTWAPNAKDDTRLKTNP